MPLAVCLGSVAVAPRANLHARKTQVQPFSVERELERSTQRASTLRVATGMEVWPTRPALTQPLNVGGVWEGVLVPLCNRALPPGATPVD